MVRIFSLILSLCLSFSFAGDKGDHLRLDISADVKGETEPCG